MASFMMGLKQREEASEGVPSLKESAQQALKLNKNMLGNVANIPLDLLEPVLCTMTPDELSRVEDKTREEGGLDISRHTWQHWLRHCQMSFGDIRKEEVDKFEEDEESKLPENAGDYRSYYYETLRRHAEQRERIAEKTRRIMEENRLQKEKSKAKFINAVIPGKTRCLRGRNQATTALARKNANLTKAIGLHNKISTKVQPVLPLGKPIAKPLCPTPSSSRTVTRAAQPQEAKHAAQHQAVKQAALPPLRSVDKPVRRQANNKARTLHPQTSQSQAKPRRVEASNRITNARSAVSNCATNPRPGEIRSTHYLGPKVQRSTEKEPMEAWRERMRTMKEPKEERQGGVTILGPPKHGVTKLSSAFSPSSRKRKVDEICSLPSNSPNAPPPRRVKLH